MTAGVLCGQLKKELKIKEYYQFKNREKPAWITKIAAGFFIC